MVILVDSLEPLVVVRGEAARKILEQVQLRPEGSGPAAPRDFAEAMRRVEAEVYNV